MLASDKAAIPEWRATPGWRPAWYATAKGRGLTKALAGAWLLLQLAACGTPADKLPPIPSATSSDYRLGPGDQVRIITVEEPALTGEFRVGAAGYVALPMIGNVHAAGLTARQLAHATAQMLEQHEMFRNPNVTVEVTQYRPFFVLGEVARPGQYPYQPGMTVVTAVAVAGGFTYRAVEDVFSIVRANNRDPGAPPIEGRAERQTPVQPGDVVTVFERRF